MNRGSRLRLESLEARQLLAADGALLRSDSYEIQQNSAARELDVLQNDLFDADYAGSRLLTSVSLGDRGGRISITSDRQRVHYTPPADVSGTERFTYFVDHEHEATVTIEIASPLRDDKFALVPDRSSFTLDVLANDPFWEGYTGAREITLLSASVRGANVEVNPADQSVRYEPLPHAYGRDTLTYVVDGKYPATITVDLTDPLREDRIQLPQFAEGMNVSVLANDPFWRGYAGEREITHVLDVPEGAQAQIAADGNAFFFNPGTLEPGTYHLRYVVDGAYEAGVSVHVARPVMDDQFTVDRNSTAVEMDLLGNDHYRALEDYRRVIDIVERISIVGPSEQGATIEALESGQGVHYTPPAGFVGTDSFRYTADGVYEATVTVQVVDPFDQDRPRDDYVTVTRGTTDTVLNVLGNDFFGNGYPGPRQITALTAVEGGEARLTASRQQVLFKPADEATSASFTYEVDGLYTAQVRVGIRPIAASQTYWFTRPEARRLAVIQDLEFPSNYRGARRITAVSSPDGGGQATVSEDGRSILYEPGVGAESFRYTLDGRFEGSIRVAYRQRLNGDYEVVFQNSAAQELDVLANDFDLHSERRWGRYTGPRNITSVELVEPTGTVSIGGEGEYLLYEPAQDFVGQQQIRYVVDGFLEATAVVDVARLLRHDRVRVAPGVTDRLNVLANDLVGGDYQGARQITGVELVTAGATVTVAEDGLSVLYTPPAGFVGQDRFTYVVDDQLKADVTVEVHASTSTLYPQVSSLDAFRDLVLQNLDLRYQGLLPGGNILEDSDVFRANFGASRDHSETNVQVEGVDEADLIETDSDHLYVLSHGQLVITRAWPADDMEVLSRSHIDGTPLGMYLHDNRLTVVSQSFHYQPWDHPLIDGWDRIWFPPQDAQTILTVFDVTDRSQPTLVQRTEIDGEHVQSRRIEDVVYVVVRDRESLLPQPREVCEGEGEEHICRLETPEELRDRVQQDFASVVEDLLPSYQSFGPDGELQRGGLLVQPEDVFAPLREGAASLVSVVGVDMTQTEPGLVSTAGVLTHGAAELYVTQDSLYVFEQHYPWQRLDVPDSPTTSILRFDFEAHGVRFAASGEVPGRMVNQFSADAYEDHLRIATTVVNSRTGNYSGDTENVLFVLRDDGGVLEPTGTIEHLALNETIQSVRFLGARAVVSTFAGVDPLFSLDLADPQHPQVEGFLTLPGLASYLQFIDEDHLLTIGRNTAVAWAGPVTISLFDVSDLLQPRLLDQFDWQSFSRSVAESDHHAFGWFANHQTLAIPSQRSYTLREDRDGDGYAETPVSMTDHQLHAFRIDAQESGEGIELVGAMDLSSPLLRSAYIGDKLYAIATDSIQSASIATPEDLLGEVDIRPVDPPEPSPDVDPLGPQLERLSASARDQLAGHVGVRPEEVMVVSTDTQETVTRVLLRVGDMRYVYAGDAERSEELPLRLVEGDLAADATLRWHHAESPLDTNADGQITPRDALVAINALNRGWAGQLPSASVLNQLQRTELPYLIDTNNDGHASPIDVLRIIRYLNAGQASPAAVVDAVLAASLWEDDEAERETPVE